MNNGGGADPSDRSYIGANTLKREYDQYWLNKAKGKYKFGLELECCVPKTKWNALCESWQKLGLCDKNLISPGTDCSVHYDENRESYYGLEIRVQPLAYSEAMEVWKKLGKSVAEHGGRFGDECNAGGHIHVDKPKDKWEQVQIVTHFANLSNKAKFFGRGEEVGEGEDYQDTYGNMLGGKVVDIDSLRRDGHVYGQQFEGK
jgi:hypothetical protein